MADELEPDFDYGTSIVIKDGKYGIIDQTGNYVVKPSYQSIAKSLSNQLYIVEQKNKYGVLDAEGKVILKPNYTDIYSVANIICASKDEAARLFNLNGKLMIKKSFLKLEYGYNSSADYYSFIYEENGKYGSVIYRK